MHRYLSRPTQRHLRLGRCPKRARADLPRSAAFYGHAARQSWSGAAERKHRNPRSKEAVMANALSDRELGLMDAYWRAANYLSVGQIYLYDNPLLKQTLTKEHIKPRLLGHWGTTPGLNFIYVHLNRLIKKHDLDMIYVTGPGHGGPGLVANAYLEGTYTEVYPN